MAIKMESERESPIEKLEGQSVMCILLSKSSILQSPSQSMLRYQYADSTAPHLCHKTKWSTYKISQGNPPQFPSNDFQDYCKQAV